MDPKHSCTAEIRLDSAPDKVWKALTDPDLVQRYFYGTRIDSDFRPGSPVRWRGEWQGKAYEDKGEILAAQPGRRLAATLRARIARTRRCAHCPRHADLPCLMVVVCPRPRPARGSGLRRLRRARSAVAGRRRLGPGPQRRYLPFEDTQ